MKNNLNTKNDICGYRPIPFYFVTTSDPKELTYEKIYDALLQLKKNGFGGVIIFNKPPHGFSAEEFLGESWFKMVEHFIKAGIELSLKIWCNDDFNFPPGDVAGRVHKADPSLKQLKLEAQDDKIIVKEVEWGFPAFENPKSSELFIKLVYEEYKKHLGQYFGKGFTGFFSDADNRRVNSQDMVDPTQRRYFPWSVNFKETFIEKFGYDIEPHLKAVLSGASCKQTADYWRHSGFLYQQWFVNNYKWCRKNGLEYTFHTSDTSPFSYSEALRSSCFSEGIAVEMERNCDYPGTDQELLEINGGKHYTAGMLYTPSVSWGGDDLSAKSENYYCVYGDLRAKQAGSAAFLYDKKGAMCEMFAATNWGVTYTELREIAAYQIMQGISMIVPHAYHHRLLGETKYFAPPDFSPKSHLSCHMREFNDEISAFAWAAGRGRLIAPIAVLDITAEIWVGKGNSAELFTLCEKLNRLPYGYVIATIEDIERKADEFKAVICSQSVSNDILERLKALGLSIITSDELDTLDKIVSCGISYVGEGKPHFVRRRLENGDEAVLIANIEDGIPTEGTLNIRGDRYELILYPGDWACISPDFVRFRKPAHRAKQPKTELPQIMNVTWERENILPIERWETEDGLPVLKSGDDGKIFFKFRTDKPLSKIRLLVSQRHMAAVKRIVLNGTPLTAKNETEVFDDKYLEFDISTLIGIGMQELTIEKTGSLDYFDNIYLSGEFDVYIDIAEPLYALDANQYNLNRYIPQKADVRLTRRSSSLSVIKSWTKQGHPFYSGKVTYNAEVNIPTDYGRTVLYLPQVKNVCSVKINGKELGARLWAPYEYETVLEKGLCKIELTVCNTLANQLEGYCASSGILDGGAFYPVAD